MLNQLGQEETMSMTPSNEAIKQTFSEFIRNASTQEKRHVFMQVIKNVDIEQQQILDKAKPVSLRNNLSVS